MAIELHDETGFVVVVTKDGKEVGKSRVDYANLSESVKLAAIRNGFSQWLTDVGAGKTFDDHVKAYNAKLERLLSGEAPREGGGGRSKAHPLSEIVYNFLRARGQKSAEAREMSRDPQAVADAIGQQLAAKTGKPAEVLSEKVYAAWTLEYNRRREANDLTALLSE